MKKRIVFCTIISILCVFFFVFVGNGCAKANDLNPALENENINLNENFYDKDNNLKAYTPDKVQTDNEYELENLIEMCINRKNDAHIMAEAARALGYPENHPVIQLAKREWHIIHDMQLEYSKTLENLRTDHLANCAKEYPVATKVWIYLKELGYNNYVCAGIIGNMMTECGGQTLNLRPELYSSNGDYYGICQWSKRYYPEIHGATLDNQLVFLSDTIKNESDNFGYKYVSNFNFEDFLELNSSTEAALAFAKAYERCGSDSYSVRQSNAELAYNYFVN